MTATYGCWQVSPKPLPFFLSDLFRRLSPTALVFDDCMENDTWCEIGLVLVNLKVVSTYETRKRNPKRTAKVSFNRRNPKPETRNRQRKLVSSDETRNPKPTAKVGFKRRNPKPETDSESWFQVTKPETRNRQRKWVSIDETRNPKPETDSESWFQATKPETRNRQRKWVSIDETRNPKPGTDSNPTFVWLSGSELLQSQQLSLIMVNIYIYPISSLVILVPIQ